MELSSCKSQPDIFGLRSSNIRRRLHDLAGFDFRSGNVHDRGFRLHFIVGLRVGLSCFLDVGVCGDADADAATDADADTDAATYATVFVVRLV